MKKRALTFAKVIVGEKPETVCVFTLEGVRFYKGYATRGGWPKSEGLANSFLMLCFCLLLKSVREQTTSPGCPISQLVCAKHTLCLCRGSGLPVPPVSAFLSAAVLAPLSSPSFPLSTLVGHCSFSNLQPAPLGQPLIYASISLCGSTSALLYREEETLVPNRRL